MKIHVSKLQANDATIEAELLDPDSGSDVDEDAEAKLTRLRQAAGAGQQDEASESTPGSHAQRVKQSKGKNTGQKAGDDASGQVWQGMAVSTEGPITIDPLDPASPDDSLLAAQPMPAQNGIHLVNGHNRAHIKTAAEQKGLPTRAQALLPPAANGHAAKQSPGKLVPKIAKRAAQVMLEAQPADRDQQGSEPGVTHTSNSAPAFIWSKAFDGEKQGYHFGKGKQGLGYYRDSRVSDGPLSAAKRRRKEAEVSQASKDGETDDAIAEFAARQDPQDGTDNTDAVAGEGQIQRILQNYKYK